jgi:hypothetical protein
VTALSITIAGYRLPLVALRQPCPSLDMTHTFVIVLSSYDLIPQCGCEGDVE